MVSLKTGSVATGMPPIQLDQAVKLLVAERRALLREHCALDLLQAYHDGKLGDERRDAVAEHLAVCEDCTILLLYGVIAASPTWAPEMEICETDIEHDWTRLEPQLKSSHGSYRSLAQVLADGPLATGDALAFAVHVGRVLTTLHGEGRVVSDLRAENVVVSPAGDVRLRDRGFAPTPEGLGVGHGGTAEAVMNDLYRSLSPEQIAGEDPTPASNVFSFGVLVYELLTGSVSPFRGDTPFDTASRIISLDPIPPNELNPELEPSMVELLTRMLAKKPEARPSSAAVLRAIESAAGPERTSMPEIADVSADIERLYDRIITLAKNRSPADDNAASDEEIERCYGQLRLLQAAEARAFRADFEASLGMPVDAGKRILNRVADLRKELEDLASADDAAGDANGTPTSAQGRG